MKSNNIPKIGEIVEVLDIYGMMISKRKYLGIGHTYHTHDNKIFYKEPGNNYYVFERLEENTTFYKYAAARPYFNETEFIGFKVERYGNDLEHLFVDFNQEYFCLSDDHSKIPPDSFNLQYDKSKANSGPRGSFLEK